MRGMTFGRHLRDEWLLDPAITYLNHPTVGATPRRVLVAQRAIQDEVERQPSRFLLRELTAIVVGSLGAEAPRLRVAADAVAAFVGARGDDVVFVDNATTGANAVLRSFPFQPGDEILDQRSRLRRDHARPRPLRRASVAATVQTVVVPAPFHADAIADAFEDAVGPADAARHRRSHHGRSRRHPAAGRHRDAVEATRRRGACRRRARAWRDSRSTCRRLAWTGTWPTCTSGRSCRAAAGSCGRRRSGSRGFTLRSSRGGSIRGSPPSSTWSAPAMRRRTWRLLRRWRSWNRSASRRSRPTPTTSHGAARRCSPSDGAPTFDTPEVARSGPWSR